MKNEAAMPRKVPPHYKVLGYRDAISGRMQLSQFICHLLFSATYFLVLIQNTKLIGYCHMPRKHANSIMQRMQAAKLNPS